MREKEMQKYQKLNELADRGGLVVFGGSNDLHIPLGEIRQAFGVEEKMYNRSVADLSLKDATAAYDACIAPLEPTTIFLHLGQADMDLLDKDPDAFTCAYRKVIMHIRNQNKHCRIAVVSLRGRESDTRTERSNQYLKHIADSEKCEYLDITEKRVWNPKNTKEAVSFVYSLGFVRPLKNKRPLHDLARMLYCYEG